MRAYRKISYAPNETRCKNAAVIQINSWVIVPGIEHDIESGELVRIADFTFQHRAKMRINTLMNTREASPTTPLTMAFCQGKVAWFAEKNAKAHLVEWSEDEVTEDFPDIMAHARTGGSGDEELDLKWNDAVGR